jgi:hypothetical protein
VSTAIFVNVHSMVPYPIILGFAGLTLVLLALYVPMRKWVEKRHTR